MAVGFGKRAEYEEAGRNQTMRMCRYLYTSRRRKVQVGKGIRARIPVLQSTLSHPLHPSFAQILIRYLVIKSLSFF